MLPRVAQMQRARLIYAMADASQALGAARVTVADVVERAGVSRRTFYELFGDCKACLLAAIEDALGQASAEVRGARERGARWEEGIRDALAALLAFADREPGLARLLVLESVACGPEAIRMRKRVLARLAAAIDEGRNAGGRRTVPPPPLTAEATVGAVLAVVHSRIACGHEQPLGSLTDDLMSTIVLPYLGTAAARSQLGRSGPEPARRRAGTAHASRVLRELEVRLTDRTIEVLLALAGNPGASNRQIGLAARVRDQGQVSKLLARLQRHGVIENVHAGRRAGRPNSWQLTSRGQALVELLAAGRRA